MAYKQPQEKPGYTEEDGKIDFKNMAWEYEFEIAMARRLFLESRMMGRDEMEVALELVEGLIVEAWKDEAYIIDLNNALALVNQNAFDDCKDKDGVDESRWNDMVKQSIMLRWKALNELFSRTGKTPQKAEHGRLSLDALKNTQQGELPNNESNSE
jgi:hypothetical protein